LQLTSKNLISYRGFYVNKIVISDRRARSVFTHFNWKGWFGVAEPYKSKTNHALHSRPYYAE